MLFATAQVHQILASLIKSSQWSVDRSTVPSRHVHFFLISFPNLTNYNQVWPSEKSDANVWPTDFDVLILGNTIWATKWQTRQL